MLTLASESQETAGGMAAKSVSFRYSASKELDSLFEDFLLMCNDAIRTASHDSDWSSEPQVCDVLQFYM